MRNTISPPRPPSTCPATGTPRSAALQFRGVLWYQRDFDAQPQPGTRTSSISARPTIAPTSGSTRSASAPRGRNHPFDCEVTAVLHPGSNFVSSPSIPLAFKMAFHPSASTVQLRGLTRDVSSSHRAPGLHRRTTTSTSPTARLRSRNTQLTARPRPRRTAGNLRHHRHSRSRAQSHRPTDADATALSA